MGHSVVQLDGQTRNNVNTDKVEVGTTAVQPSTSTRDLKWGVQIIADGDNANGVWVGVRSNISAGTAGTSGVKLEPGASILVPARSEADVWMISDAAAQSVTYLAF